MQPFLTHFLRPFEIRTKEFKPSLVYELLNLNITRKLSNLEEPSFNLIISRESYVNNNMKCYFDKHRPSLQCLLSDSRDRLLGVSPSLFLDSLCYSTTCSNSRHTTTTQNQSYHSKHMIFL